MLAWTVLRALLGAATARSPHLGALLLSNEALDAFQMQALLQTSSDSVRRNGACVVWVGQLHAGRVSLSEPMVRDCCCMP